MAQKTLVIFTDDLTGKGGEDITTHTFALDGTDYEIDLGGASHDKLLKALAPFMEKGRRQKKTRGGSRPSAAPKHDIAAIRAWAKENGHEVNERGRIPRGVVEAYEAANK